MDQDDDDQLACDNCGIVFTSVGHLVKHSKECQKDNKHEDSDSSKAEEEEEDEEEDEEENLEESAFSVFRLEAVNEVRETEEWGAKYNEFIGEGEEEDNAAKLTDGEFEKLIIKTGERLYRNHLVNALFLQNGEVHKGVSDAVWEYCSKGYTPKKAAKLAIKDNLSNVRVLLEDEEDDDSDSTDDDGEGN